jgi:hypothetical protein
MGSSSNVGTLHSLWIGSIPLDPCQDYCSLKYHST